MDGSDPLALCEQRIGYVFQDKTHLVNALTHASGADHRLASNERLEFLGDAILGKVACEMLYHRFPEYLEGELTRIKSIVVSRQTCAKLSQVMKLDEFLILGKGMAASPTLPKSLSADVFEAIVAAIYLDGGNEQVEKFIKDQLTDEIEAAAIDSAGGNFKSQLQQYAQREFGVTPNYLLLDEKGPDHSKCFKVTAQVSGTKYPPAWGMNKKEAEQRAAQNAISDIEGVALPFASD